MTATLSFPDLFDPMIAAKPSKSQQRSGKQRKRGRARAESATPEAESAPAPAPARSSKPRVRATAESMAAQQRDISVSEFFAKNRHLLGFDNPRKALLTSVKEAVDNSLDAC